MSTPSYMVIEKTTPPSRRRGPTDAQIDLAVLLYCKQIWPLKAIAARMGVHESTVWRWLTEYAGIDLRPRGPIPRARRR